MRIFKKFLSCLLCAAMIVTALPAAAAADTASSGTKSIDNGYIKVQVSEKNGGFAVNTVQGDLVKKSDNNKKLLFHNDEYDTSFISYRVEFADGTTEDYIFGGKYGGLFDKSRKGVSVTQKQANGDIIAAWGTGDLTFTQTITLANTSSDQHGMVSVQLAVQNEGSAKVSVKARILLDTYLGSKDYGYYQVLDKNNVTNLVTTEQIIDGKGALSVPQNFYAVDDAANPGIVAYSVSNLSDLPYQVALGHWNNLAASLFDFTPSTIDFTKDQNDYLTSDSAYALYYDMGDVAATDGSASLVSYYGVYSNSTVSSDQNVSINATAPLRLELNDEKTAFKRLDQTGAADFTIDAIYENLNVTGAKKYDQIKLVVQSTSNLRSLDDNGQVFDRQQFDTYDPFVASTNTNVKVGDILNKKLYFKAKLSNEAAYERITISVYDVSSKSELTDENRLGVKEIYILLPGTDGNIPKVAFASMTPDTVYFEGTRHLFVTVTNPAMLTNRANWNLYAYNSADSSVRIEIPHSNISMNDNVMDVTLDDTMKTATGSWYLQLEWTADAVKAGIATKAEAQTSSQLKFSVSDNTKYKNDSYGVLAIVKKDYGGKKPTEYTIESFMNEEAYERYLKEDGTGEYTLSTLIEFKGAFVKSKYKLDSDGKTKVGTYFTAVSTKELDTNTREYKTENCVTINGCMDFEGGTLSVYYEDYDNTSLSKCLDSAICVEFDGELLTSDARTSIWSGNAGFTKIEQGEDYALRPYDKDGNRKDEESFSSETISLIWPSVYGTAQTLAGMIFKMAYGELGVMYNDDGSEIGRVLSFTAQLDLSFTGHDKGNSDEGTETTTYWSKLKDIWKYYRTGDSVYTYTSLGGGKNDAYSFHLVDEDKANDEESKATASVMVQDILFGCGEGFVGVHFKVDIGLKNYVSGMSNIAGSLEVNTVHNWSVGLEGKMKLASIQLEAKLKFKSRNNIPVPDDIYFYVDGFEPGLNIDGFGVVWITGGGGGISNLYDTIYSTGGTPPLKLILSLAFSIVQTLDGTATVTASASNLTLEAKDLKVFGEIPAINYISLGLTWKPNMDIRASMNLHLYGGVISGAGYIVLTNDDVDDDGLKEWFYEMYAQASLQVPESIPAVGGKTIGGANLGLNTEKIWGGLNVLSIDLGIVYYWGESSVDFFTGDSTKVQPTFPDLLQLNGINENGDVPVYYDEENDRTLYAHVGSNLSDPVEAVTLATDGTKIDTAEADSANLAETDSASLSETDSISLMSGGSLQTSADYTLHKFNLGEYRATSTYYASTNSASMVQVEYDASSKAEAEAIAKRIKINSVYDASQGKISDSEATAYPLKYLEGTNITNGSAEANAANANVSYNAATKKGILAFTVTDSKYFDTDWYIYSGAASATGGAVNSKVTFYNVQSLPKITSVEYTKNARKDPIYTDTLTFKGENLTEIDDIKFYLVSSNDPKETGYLLDQWEDGISDYDDNDMEEWWERFPDDLPSGDYYVKAVYSVEDELYDVCYSTDTVSYTNPNMPATITAGTAASAGDLKLGVTLNDKNAENIDGYMVSVYNADGTATNVTDMPFEKAAEGNTYIEIGGSYSGSSNRVDNEDGTVKSQDVNTYGLTEGTQYKLVITPYKLIDSQYCVYNETSGKDELVSDGENDSVIYGKEVTTNAVTLAAQTTPQVSFAADKIGISVAGKSGLKDANGDTKSDDKVLTFASDEIKLTARAAGGEALTGTWSLDGAESEDTDTDGTALSDSKYGHYGTFDSQTSVSIPLKNLTDGRHKLTVSGKDADGDGFRAEYVFAVDTEAPRLMIASPVNGTPTDADGVLTISGVTDEDALLTVVVGTTTVIDGKTISEIPGAAIDKEGNFSFSINAPWASIWLEKDITISAKDVLGNKTETTATIASGLTQDLKSVLIKVDGASDEDGNIEGNATATQTKKLSLVGKNSAGNEMMLDSDYVLWECMAVEGAASVTSDGTLTIGEGAQGIVTGKYEVSSGAYMTYTLCFGADISNSFVYAGGEGGSVIGSGYYRQGEKVSLTASSNIGYKFKSWKIVSGLADESALSTTSSEKTTFTMPEGNVLLQAEYDWIGLPKETTPEAEFEAAGDSGGKLTNVEPGMKYSLDGGKDWIDITDTSVEISDISTSHGIIVKKSGNGTTTADSDVQTITVTKAAAPQSPRAEDCTTSKNNNGKIIGVSTKMQYKSADERTWNDCAGETVEGLVPGDYQVRLKPSGSVLASDAVTVTIDKYVPGAKEPAVKEVESVDAGKDDLVIVDPATGKATKKAAFSDSEAAPIGKDNEILTVKSGDLPFCYDEYGQKVFVPFSAEKDGKIVFIAPKDGKYYFTENSVSFKDMAGHWAQDEVDFTAAREIFNGIGDDNFGPNSSMTRAMFVTVLWRMSGKPSVADISKAKSFTDIDSSAWYAEAVAWGSANGIVNGVSDSEFAPNNLVTREQMCTLLSRFLKYKDISLKSTAEAIEFTDKAQISSWAEDAVTLCQQAGLITGYPDGSFKPKGNAARAENAAVFERMIKTVLEQAEGSQLLSTEKAE